MFEKSRSGLLVTVLSLALSAPLPLVAQEVPTAHVPTTPWMLLLSLAGVAMFVLGSVSMFRRRPKGE